MDRDSVVVGGIYRTRQVNCATYEPGSIVRAVRGYNGVHGVRTELLFGATKDKKNKTGFVWFHELEELE